MAHNCKFTLIYSNFFQLSSITDALQSSNCLLFPLNMFPSNNTALKLFSGAEWCFCESCNKMLCVHSVIETHNEGAREQVCTIESQNIRGIESCLLRVCERERSWWIRQTQANICTLCQSLAERTLRCCVSVNKQLLYGKADYEHKETSI